MSAFASFATRMKFRTALWAFLFPSLSNRLLDFCFRDSRGTNPDHPRFIRLLHGALGMDATQRIRGPAADGTDIFRRRWDNDYGLFATHVAPKANAVFDRSVKIRWRWGIIPHFTSCQQKQPAVRMDSCRRSTLRYDYPTQGRPPSIQDKVRLPSRLSGRSERDQDGGPPSGPAKEKEQADLERNACHDRVVKPTTANGSMNTGCSIAPNDGIYHYCHQLQP
jgi:hypothetical protein